MADDVENPNPDGGGGGVETAEAEPDDHRSDWPPSSAASSPSASSRCFSSAPIAGPPSWVFKWRLPSRSSRRSTASPWPPASAP
ncbi:hypothetical protein ACP70R_042857 [Stipagrostis hirtigluma subsp. patula]